MANEIPPQFRNKKRPAHRPRLAEQKDIMLSVYLTANEHRLFKSFCFELDISMNKFVRKLILQAIQPGWIELKEKDVE